MPVNLVKLDCTSSIKSMLSNVMLPFVWLIDVLWQQNRTVCLSVCVRACMSLWVACVFMSLYWCVGPEFSPSLKHFHFLPDTHAQPLFTVGLAKLLSEQMTKNKTVSSFLPTSPMLSVMAHINHTKLPCTQGPLLFLSLPLTCPLQTCSANEALFLADGFLMAAL